MARGAPETVWAEALQALADFIAHDFRNALNGVAVNLEVVRARSVRGADVTSIAPFATTAAAQFETATAGAEALLGFVRREPEPADVAAIVARLSRLLALRGAEQLRVSDGSEGRARTTVSGDVVRAAVARCVLGSLAATDTIACEIDVDDGIFVRITGAMHTLTLPEPEFVALALAHGVRIAIRGPSLELRFPAVDSRATPNASS